MNSSETEIHYLRKRPMILESLSLYEYVIVVMKEYELLLTTYYCQARWTYRYVEAGFFLATQPYSVR